MSGREDQVDVERLRELEAAATPGPWLGVTDNGRKNGIGLIGREDDRGTGKALAVFAGVEARYRRADVQLVAEARNALPELLDELEHKDALLTEVVEVLQVWMDEKQTCPWTRTVALLDKIEQL